MENEYEVNSVSLEMMDRDAVEASAAESQSESSSLSNSLESGLTVEISRGGDADSKKLVKPHRIFRFVHAMLLLHLEFWLLLRFVRD